MPIPTVISDHGVLGDMHIGFGTKSIHLGREIDNQNWGTYGWIHVKSADRVQKRRIHVAPCSASPCISAHLSIQTQPFTTLRFIILSYSIGDVDGLVIFRLELTGRLVNLTLKGGQSGRRGEVRAGCDAGRSILPLSGHV